MMQALIIALITTIGALITAIIGGIYSNRKINKALALHDQKSTHDNATRSNEHEGLSKEHQSLAQGFSRETASLNSQILMVSSDVRVIRERQAEDRAKHELQYSNLNDSQKQLINSAKDIGKFAQEFAQLASENEKLKEENIALKQERLQLVQQYKELKQKLDQQQQQKQSRSPQWPNERADYDIEPEF